MIIKLNPELKETIIPEITERDRQKLIEHLKWKSQQENSKTIKGLSDSSVLDLQLGFLYYLSNAYSLHRKICLAPHDIWYVILTEITKIIEANSEKCRPLFTQSQGKVDVVILTDDVTSIDPICLLEKLKELVPVNTDIFLPTFSTAYLQYTIAAAATFAGGLKVYYDYMTCMCGIPEIKIQGTVADWETISNQLNVICQMFKDCGINEFKGRALSVWSFNVSSIIDEICKGLNGKDITEFMKGIYTEKNIGSGSEVKISGWIADIYCEICDFPKLENFSMCVGILPYENLETGRKFVGVHGLFNCKKDPEGFVYPTFDEIILETGE